MYILIDERYPELAEQVLAEVRKQRPDDTVLSEPHPDYRPGTGVSVVALTETLGNPVLDKPVPRWEMLHLATNGVRYWAGEGDPLNPIYAGAPESAEKIVVDANYAEMRAAYVASFGVTYLGRTYVAPRTVILVESDHPALFPSTRQITDVRKILGNLPKGSEGLSPWSSFALVQAPDLRKLRKFVDDHWDTNFLAYTTKDKNRLKKIGVEFGEIKKPVDEPAYGIHVRSVASLLRPYENSEIEFSVEVPEV